MAIFLHLSCYAGTTHELISDDKYLEFGKKFECVVFLKIEDKDNKYSFASGVIIDKNWILTAAHAVNNCKNVKLNILSHDYVSTKIICHSDFIDNNIGLYDIALIRIDNNIDLPFYPELYTKNDHLNKISAISGYGISSKASKIEYNFDNKRRAGSNVIESYDKHMVICSMSKTNQSILEFILTSGDSGGGLFIDGKLAGINSCLIAEDGDLDGSYGDLSGHTRIDIFTDWIRDTKENYIYP